MYLTLPTLFITASIHTCTENTFKPTTHLSQSSQFSSTSAKYFMQSALVGGVS